MVGCVNWHARKSPFRRQTAETDVCVRKRVPPETPYVPNGMDGGALRLRRIAFEHARRTPPRSTDTIAASGPAFASDPALIRF